MAKIPFYQRSPAAYRISVARCRFVRRWQNLRDVSKLADEKSAEFLPFVIYQNQSLIRRTLGDVDPALQNNKAVNLGLAAPHVDGIIIPPGKIFSFWTLVGNCTARRGYLPGLTISGGRVSSGVGGGMCQMTNMIHWLILHTPLRIVEHHHHDGMDLFPDNGRTIPFGTGTSIMYNYLDYRFLNDTPHTYQLRLWVTDTHLNGEIRAAAPLPVRYHIRAEDEYFSREGDAVYRNGRVYHSCVDKRTGYCLNRELIKVNHALVMYDTSGLDIGCQADTAAEEST